MAIATPSPHWSLPLAQHRFFAQLWGELSGDDTIDTWQVRSCTPSSLLSEALSIVETGRDFPPALQDLQHVVAEARTAIFEDPIIERHYPFARNYVEAICRHQEGNRLTQLVDSLGVLVEYLRDYRARAAVYVVDLLNTGDAKQKILLNRVTLSLATSICSDGYSPRHLDHLGSYLLQDNGNITARFERLLGECSGRRRSFMCTFIVNGAATVREGLGKFHAIKTWLHPPTSRPSSHGERIFYGLAGNEDFFVTLRQDHLDMFNALLSAQKVISDALNVVTMARPDLPASMRGNVALVRPDGEKAWAVGPRSPLNLKQAHEVASAPGAYSDDVLTACLDFHHLGVTATSDETRLLNLWIALESLYRRHPGRKLDSICASIPMLVAQSSLMKQVRALAKYIKDSLLPAKLGEVTDCLPSSTATYVNESDLLNVLLEPEDGARVNKLCQIASDSPLLCYRIFKLHKYLSTAAKLRANLDRHRINVDWQLRRIYRARNVVTHQGRRPDGLPMLVRHLHNYLVGAVRAVRRDLADVSGRWSVREALHARVQQFNYMSELLQSNTPISKEALLDPRRLLGPQAEPYAWSPVASPPTKT